MRSVDMSSDSRNMRASSSVEQDDVTGNVKTNAPDIASGAGKTAAGFITTNCDDDC